MQSPRARDAFKDRLTHQAESPVCGSPSAVKPAVPSTAQEYLWTGAYAGVGQGCPS